MKRFFYDNKGTSLIELIIYIAISSFILIDTIGVVSNIVYTQTKIETIAREDENARHIMREISQNIEEAAVITTPNSSNASGSTLTLTDNSSNTINYTLSNGIIYKQVNSGSAQQLSSSDIYITNLTFTVESEAGLSPSINIKIDEQTSQTNSATKTHYETTDAQRKF